MRQVEPAMAAAFQNALAGSQKTTASIRPVAVSEMLDKLNEPKPRNFETRLARDRGLVADQHPPTRPAI
jgi:hypothetical protein